MQGEKGIEKFFAFLFAGTFALSIFLTGCGIKAVTEGTRSEFFDSIETEFRAEVTPPGPLAFWHSPDGNHLAVASSPDDDNIIVYDAEKKTVIERIGKPGKEPGEFKNPGDIRVVDYIAFVLDRGNHRVQALILPELKPFGIIGDDRLKNPSHMAVYRIEYGAYYLYITDDPQKEPDGGYEHIMRFSTGISLSSAHSNYLQTFGYTPGEGYLADVTSLAVDQLQKCLVVNEGAAGKTRKYSLDGDYIR